MDSRSTRWLPEQYPTECRASAFASLASTLVAGDTNGTLDNADWNKAPTVGCGPFIFKEWVPGDTVRFVANENFWLDRPRLDVLIVRFVPNETAQIEVPDISIEPLNTLESEIQRSQLAHLFFAIVRRLPLSGINGRHFTIENQSQMFVVAYFTQLCREPGGQL